MPQAAVVIGTTILSAVGAGAFAATATGVVVAEIIGFIVISAALYAASAALLPAPSFDVSRQKQAIRQPVAPRRRYYGTVKISGVYAFLEVRRRPNFSVSGTSNHLFALLMLAAHEIDSVLEYWLGDQQVTLNGTGLVNEAPFFTVGVRRAKLVAQLGTDGQTAHSELTTYFPGEWTANHRLRGIANILGVFKAVEAHHFTKVFPQGVPQIRVTIRAAKVWDPRDPAQDPDDPTTWTWTENAALIVMDYLWHADGMRLPRALIVLAIDEWKAAATACEEQIPLAGGGTEDRFRLSGGYEFNAFPRDVLTSMLNCIGGVNCLRMRGDGAITLEMPDYYDPDIVLTHDHINHWNFRRHPEVGDLRNEIRARYVDPDNEYQEQEAEPWIDAASIAVDGVRSETMDLTWCPSHAQARRRMKLEAYRRNPEWIGTIETNAYGLNVIGERLIRVVIPDMLIDDVFEVTSLKFTMVGRVEIGLRSMPAEAFDWTAADEEGEPPGSEIASEGSEGEPDGPTGTIEEVTL